MSKTKHFPCGPSSLQRRFACPGSYQMEKDMPDVESVNAKGGTDLHAALAAMIVGPGREGDVSDFDAGALAFASGLARKLIEANPDCQVEIERFIDLAWIHPLIGGGTADLVLTEPMGRVLIVDWKFYYQKSKVPHPKDNLQTLAYACGLAREFEATRVEIMIVFPHEAHAVRHVWDYEYLIGDGARRLKAIADACDPQGDAKFSGPSLFTGPHCKYCKAIGVCPAMKHDADKLPVKVEPSALAGKDLGEWLDRAEIVEEYIGKLRQHAYAILTAGGVVPGWALKPGRSSRAIEATKETLRELMALAKKKKLKKESLYTVPELLSPAQLEKVLGKSDTLDGLIQVKPGNPKLTKGE